MAMAGMCQEARIDQGVDKKDKKDGSRNESGMPRASRRATCPLFTGSDEWRTRTSDRVCLARDKQGPNKRVALIQLARSALTRLC